MIPEVDLIDNLKVDSEDYYGHLSHLSLNEVFFYNRKIILQNNYLIL
jgi:hypothetical protein